MSATSWVLAALATTGTPDAAAPDLSSLARLEPVFAPENVDLGIALAAIQDTPEALPAGFWERSEDSADAYVIKVTDKEDLVGRSMRRILTSRLGIGDMEDVSFSTVWIVETRASGPASHDLAGEIAVARGWRRGLLANPHCQDAQVYSAEEYFAEEVSPA